LLHPKNSTKNPMNSEFDFIKESTGGVTIIANDGDNFFGPNLSPRFKIRGNELFINIDSCEFKVSPTDTINIDTGNGPTQFVGNVAALKAALIPVFPKANSSAGGSGDGGGSGGSAEPQFTTAQYNKLIQIIESYNP
jgi:hypothetical protein